MAKKIVVELMVDGGKAAAGAQLGGTLGPLKMNLGQVVADINKRTEIFKGMKVPVKLEVNPETKEYAMSIGTPPVSQLIVKDVKAGVKTVIGSCRSMGILVEGKEPAEMMKELNAGTYDTMIKAENVEISDPEKKARFKDLGKELSEKMRQVAKAKAEAKAAAEASATAAAAAGAAPAAASPGKVAAAPASGKGSPAKK